MVAGSETSPSDWPPISIVTPSLNQGPFIEETIRSVLLQGYPAVEYMVLDGGSSDETPTILEKYRGWLAVCSSEPDAGQADAIRRALHLASGELFNWVNADDVLMPGSLTTVAQLMKGEADVVAAAATVVAESGATWAKHPRRLTVRGLVHGDERMDLCQPAIWLRRTKALACGGPDPGFHYFFDHEMYLRYLTLFPKVTYGREVIARYRLHEASKTVTSPASFQREYVRALEKLSSLDGFEPLHGLCRRRLKELEQHAQVAGVLEDSATSRLRRALSLLVLTSRAPRPGMMRISLWGLRRLLRGGGPCDRSD